MCAALTHRGPDDAGFYFAPGVGLGMRRLSIIDLASGRQPVSSEDGSVQVVFNGEIYNYQQLRHEMADLGHRFATQGDSETIAHLYEEFGLHCVDHLRGMFAFAVWDARLRRLVVARDRMGIKPLYYAEAGGRLVFASEVKALLQLPELGRALNWGSVAHLFSFLSTPPDEAIIEGIHKLEPGHMLVAAPGQTTRVERYWALRFEPDDTKPEQYFVEGVRGLIEESVRLHLVSDVPLGAFLSGGIDSSAIVATAARLKKEPVRTFSVGFAEVQYDELAHARFVARRNATEHEELILGPDALDEMEDLAWYLDEPFGDSSAIPTYLVSRLAARRVKVVLSGDGGDELFAGYDKYVVEQRERRGLGLPAAVRGVMGAIGRALPEGTRGRNFLRHWSLAGAARYVDASTLFRPDDMKHLFQAEALEMIAPHQPWLAKTGFLEASEGSWLSRLQGLDMKNYLPLDILTKVDRMSMANSIETRVPLLDHKLVEFAATIPAEMNLRGGTTKNILKQAMRGILPQQIIQRPKQGFAVPLNYWFRGKLSGYVRELLLGERAGRRAIFQRSYVEKLLLQHEAGRNLDLQLWTLMSFELWARTFLDRGSRGRARQVA